MRVIKLFEEFGDKLFSEISFNEMLDKFHGKTEDFTKMRLIGLLIILMGGL